MRNTWKSGDWLVRDDESGIVYYASEMVRIWDGTYRHHTNVEHRHPQEFVEVRRESYPTEPIRSDLPYPTGILFSPTTVGSTNVLAPTGAATHIFASPDAGGIGMMQIESSFVVT